MKIYFDGCSWTKGEELENQEEERYSKLICDELGAEETNLAIKGGSNDRIVRNLLVENHIEEYDLAVIQMTLPVRTEYYMIRKGEYYDKCWRRVNPSNNYSRWLHGLDGDIRKLGEKFSDHSDFWKYWYMNITNKKFFDVKEKIHYETIKSYCETKGVPLIICSINTWSKLKFDFVLTVDNNTKCKMGHPNKLGHQLIAEAMLDKI